MTAPPTVGRYRLVRLLGQGAHASVHEAVGPDGAPVALKRLHPHVVLLRPEAVERLRREVLAAAAIDHPAVVRPLEAGVEDGVPFVALELVPGARPITQAFAGLPRADRVRLVRDAARALGAAHARGVVHRDVSAGNLLVDAAGRLRVTDFGLAWVRGEAPLTRTGVILGTPAYVAPEVALEGARAATPRSDVFALGVHLRQALAGSAGGPLERIAEQALSPRPEDRPADGAALARALDEALARVDTTAEQATPAPPAPVTPATLVERPSARLPSVGGRVGRYQLLAKLGEGGMGQVWRARDPELGRDVALKVVPTGASDDRRKRALRELEAAARVRHENVVAVHDAGETTGGVFLVMDLVEGQPLEALLRRGPLPPRRAAEVALGVARALEALHAHGVVHRDVKPANVLVAEDGVPRLTDFGVARVQEAERLTRTDQLLGTPLYMAPEQLMGEPADERADVFGLGVVLYEMLTGAVPAPGAHLAGIAIAKHVLPPPPSAAAPGVPAALDAVCLRALAPAREERYPTMRALREDLERWLGGRGVGAARPRSRRRFAAALGGLLVLGALAAAWAAPRRTPQPAPEPAAALRARRQALEGARRLALVDPAPLEAAVAGPLEDPRAEAERQALRAWLGAVRLARGDAAGAAALLGGEETPPALALRGGLTALQGGDPARAVADLERAAAGGLRFVELERWRFQALARRGVEDRAEASALLAALPRASNRAELDGETVTRVEAYCRAALGQGLEADALLQRLAAPPADLRWAVKVLAVGDLVREGRLREARDALRGVARPDGPARRHELAAAQVLVQLAARMVSGPDAKLILDEERRRLELALLLVERLAPAHTLPEPLAEGLLVFLESARFVQTDGPLLRAFADVCPERQDLLRRTCHLLLYEDGSRDESRRTLPAARHMAALADPSWRLLARTTLARKLSRAGEHDAVDAVLEELERDLARHAPDADAELPAVARGQRALSRAQRHAARGEVEAAVRALDEGEGRPECSTGERLALRLELLVGAQRYEDALPWVLSYMLTPHILGGPRFPIAEACWTVCVRLARWREVRAFVESQLDAEGLDESGLWAARRALLVAAVDGDLPRAAALLRRLRERRSFVAERVTPELVQRLERADDGAVVDLLRAAGEDPAPWPGRP